MQKGCKNIKNGNQQFAKSEKWNEKGMQTNNVIRRENGFKQYCKSLPKSYKNAPKLVPATVLEASWERLGHLRKQSRGITHFGGASGRLWTLGAPKSVRNAFWSDLFGNHFEPKIGKEASKKASQN